MLICLIVGIPLLLWLGTRAADLLTDRAMPNRADIRAAVYRPR